MYSSNLFATSIQIYIINKYNLNHLLLFDVLKCSFIARKRVSDWSLLVLHAFLGLQDDVAECVLCCVLNIKTRIVVSSNASHLVCRILLRYMFSHISTGKYTLCDKFLRSPMCGDFLLGYIWFVRHITVVHHMCVRGWPYARVRVVCDYLISVSANQCVVWRGICGAEFVFRLNAILYSITMF